ncbi:hypothetical protein DVH05_026304 [Phytophthora capsici]|nr:hypothetical protein DVH05_026304 [Phytophthora capsici]
MSSSFSNSSGRLQPQCTGQSPTTRHSRVPKQDIHADVEALRASFATGATKDVMTRKSLLRSLQKLLNENETIINDAVWKDLHKHSQGLFATEIALIHSEIQYFLDFLDDWSKPKLKATNILNLPGMTYIRLEPLGVVCVIGTWNYPVHLVLLPLVAVLGAGNCAVVRLPGDDTTRFLNKRVDPTIRQIYRQELRPGRV